MKSFFLAAAIAAATSASAQTALDTRVDASENANTPNTMVKWFNGGLVNVGTNFACISDPPILQRMNTEVNRIISTPEFRAWLIDSQAITPPTAPNSPEQFRQTLAADLPRWAEVVRASGATVD